MNMNGNWMKLYKQSSMRILKLNLLFYIISIKNKNGPSILLIYLLFKFNEMYDNNSKLIKVCKSFINLLSILNK